MACQGFGTIAISRKEQLMSPRAVCSFHVYKGQRGRIPGMHKPYTSNQKIDKEPYKQGKIMDSLTSILAQQVWQLESFASTHRREDTETIFGDTHV